MPIKFSLLAAATLAIAACAPLHRPQATAALAPAIRTDPAIQAVLDQHLGRLVAEKNIQGVVVAVVRSDGIVARAAAGVRNVETREKLAVGDLLHPGSLAKPMLATLVGTLVEEGRVGWTTKIVDIFPEWRDTIHGGYRDLTLGQLLSHRSGAPQFIAGEEWKQVPELTGSVAEQRRAFAHWVLSRPPQFPGKEFRYSNAGYGLAAAVVEKVTGREWWPLMKERVFRPLGMRSPGLGWPYTAGPGQALGHWWRDGRFVPQGPDDPYQVGRILAPAGNLHMKIDDLAAFAGMHLQGLRGRDTMLRSEAVRRMHHPEAGSNYAFGWYNDSATFDEPRSRHSGEVGTFHARIWLFPQRDLGLVAMTNADSEAAHDVTNEIFQRVRLAVIGRPPG